MTQVESQGPAWQARAGEAFTKSSRVGEFGGNCSDSISGMPQKFPFPLRWRSATGVDDRQIKQNQGTGIES